ncbi:MAG: hypothetical protein WA051_00065 [Minisyncoccia bacterium]
MRLIDRLALSVLFFMIGAGIDWLVHPQEPIGPMIIIGFMVALAVNLFIPPTSKNTRTPTP